MVAMGSRGGRLSRGGCSALAGCWAGSVHRAQSRERGQWRGTRAVGRRVLGQVWRSSSWAGEHHLCHCLLDREAVVEDL